MKVYIIWLLGVIAWNFLVPNATPIEDVIVAVILSFLSIGLKEYLNNLIQLQNKYFDNKI